MTQQKVTMKDVAERVGVSKMTVSAVLSGKSGPMRISLATQVRVREAAQQMGYRPNAVARSLRRKSTNIIGFYAGHGYLNARLPFLAEIIGGIQECCNQYHKDVLLHGVFRGYSVEDIYAELVDGRIDGLIVHAPPEDPLVDQLAASHLPVVAIADPIPTLPSVIVDDVAGANLAVDYLLSQGHRRILYRDTDKPLASAVRRREAFCEAAARQGMEMSVWHGPDDTTTPEDTLLDFLDAPLAQRPTAIFCWNDMAAYDMMLHCRQRRVRIPEDLAVLGFDGLPTPLEGVWRLTSIRAPWAEVARTAVTLLVAQLNGEQVAPQTILPVAFAPGDTA